MPAMHDNAENISVLISAEVDVHAVDEYGNTALHIAACNGTADVLKVLLASGARVDAGNRRKALHIICQPSMIKLSMSLY